MLRLVSRFRLSPNPRADILSGLTVAIALVPEAVAFAFVAQVEPLVGLYAAFIGFHYYSNPGWTPRHDLWCNRCSRRGNDLTRSATLVLNIFLPL